ncbi:MAG: hypothetical protein Q7T77_02200 [Sulfuricurvum sp.]|nr:hypothetical protein [Sulfuricurvum sp.]
MNFIQILWQKIRVRMITRVKGEGNILKIEGKIVKNSKIRVNGNHNMIVIEEGRYKNLDIGIEGNNHKLLIKSSDRIAGLKIVIQNTHNEIRVGRGVGIAEALIVACGKNNCISIGENSMISTDVAIWGCDGYSILHDGDVVNFSKSIEIGSHVWVGSSVKILKGTKIGNNSIVGLGSLLNGKEYPSNVVIVGIPGKIVKENIDWTVENLEV